MFHQSNEYSQENVTKAFQKKWMSQWDKCNCTRAAPARSGNGPTESTMYNPKRGEKEPKGKSKTSSEKLWSQNVQ